ncbi:MAG: DUF2203 family protein [Bdellovibrionales bacterium]|nr:DUF2203 family protein [Bdellovibrionales bacterium]
MCDHELIAIRGNRLFSFSQAQQVLPIIRRITGRFFEPVENLIHQLERSKDSPAVNLRDLEAKLDSLILEWHRKVIKLGGQPKGLWMVDFNSGDGYYSWSYPEMELEYWRKHNTRFEERGKISQPLEVSDFNYLKSSGNFVSVEAFIESGFGTN